MFSKVQSPAAYFVNPPFQAQALAAQPAPASVAAATTGQPYLLTRIYDGVRPFEAADQSGAQAVFRPVVRMPLPLEPRVGFDGLQQLAAPRCSRELGLYLDTASGAKAWIKTSDSRDKAFGEALAASLAQRLGFTVAPVEVIVQGGRHFTATAFDERVVPADVLFPNCAIDAEQLAAITRACPQVQHALAMAAWMNNRDIIGIGCENLGFLQAPDGSLSPVFLSFCGSFDERATHGKKVFDNRCREFVTMTNAALADECGKGGPNGMIFGSIRPSALRACLGGILAISESELRAEIDRHTPDPVRSRSLFETLVQRREAMRMHMDAGKTTDFWDTAEAAIHAGIDGVCAAGEDDAETLAQIRNALEPELSAYVANHPTLVATWDGLQALGAHAAALAMPVIAQMNAQKLDAKPVRTPIITDVTDMETEPG